MQMRIVAVGKVRERYVAQACDEFRKRIAPYYPFEVDEVKASAGTAPQTAIREEGERILKMLQPDEQVWLLERGGAELSSENLSAKIGEIVNAGTRRLTFVIGGTFGTSAALRDRADFVWSLSKLTFLHEWARMIVLEQLYRAAKIARNEPYHH